MHLDKLVFGVFSVLDPYHTFALVSVWHRKPFTPRFEYITGTNPFTVLIVYICAPGDYVHRTTPRQMIQPVCEIHIDSKRTI